MPDSRSMFGSSVRPVGSAPAVTVAVRGYTGLITGLKPKYISVPKVTLKGVPTLSEEMLAGLTTKGAQTP